MKSVLAGLTLALVLGRPGARADVVAPPDVAGPLALGDSQAQLVYTPVAPCRIVDTRLAGGVLTPGVPRQFRLTGIDLSAQGGDVEGCGVPSGRATVAFINFVAVNPAGPGNLRAWAYRTPPSPAPNSSVLNYALVTGAGLNIANALALPICDRSESGQACPLDFLVQADGSATQLVADVVGFFERLPTEELPDLAVAPGTVILWDQSNECPAGYSRADALDGRWLRGSATPGGTGGTASHDHGLAHTHGLANHTHSGVTNGGSPGAGGVSTVPEPEAPRIGHTHAFLTGGPSPNVSEGPSPSVSGSASSLPPFADVLFCRKDAPLPRAGPPSGRGRQAQRGWPGRPGRPR